MDEPFQNLDVRTKLTLGQMTRRLHQERASATLYVTHDVMEAVLLADTIMILSERPAHVVFELDLDLSEEERDPRNTRVQRIAGELYDTLLSSNQQ